MSWHLQLKDKKKKTTTTTTTTTACLPRVQFGHNISLATNEQIDDYCSVTEYNSLRRSASSLSYISGATLPHSPPNIDPTESYGSTVVTAQVQ